MQMHCIPVAIALSVRSVGGDEVARKALAISARLLDTIKLDERTEARALRLTEQNLVNRGEPLGGGSAHAPAAA